MNFDMNSSLGFILNRTALASKICFGNKIKEFDISPEQWSIIFRVVENPGLTQKTLSDTTYKDQANITRSIDRLEKKSFLKRVSNDEDRRVINIFPTKKAEQLVEEIVPISKEHNEYLSFNLTKKEYENLITLLNKIYENTQKEVK